MDIDQDIRTINDLQSNPREVIAQLRQSGRPMVIMVDGQPEAIMLSPDLMPSRKKAIEAACELAMSLH